MKKVIWKDSHGWSRCSLIRDNDSESSAPQGIPQELPPISEILRDAEMELNNELVERGLFTYADVVRSQNGITAAIVQVFRNKLLNAYKQKECLNNGKPREL
jgi:hypothetical protein